MLTAARYGIGLGLIVIVTHAPFLRDGYITDDYLHLDRIAAQPPLTTVLATPDVFGFFRPVQQFSYWLDYQVFGSSAAWRLRIVNLLLHLGVVLLTFSLARRTLNSSRAAFVAALAFALSPKANTIAIMWLSARAELLMALFSLLSLLMCLKWLERNDARWFVASASCYLLAFMSKEAGALLPVVGPFLPLRNASTKRRMYGAVLLLALGATVYLARALAGAVSPTAESPYTMLTPWHGWLKNSVNYLGRTILAPMFVVVTCGIAMIGTERRPRRPSADGSELPSMTAWLLLGVIWFIAFIAPVIPVMGRSEIRIYFAGVGFCLAAGHVVASWERRYRTTRTNAALAICVIALGSYQSARAAAMAEDLRFSMSFAAAIAQDSVLQRHHGFVLLIPETPQASRLLQDTVGAYLGRILRSTFRRADIDGAIGTEDTLDMSQQRDVMRIYADVKDGHVVLRHASY